MDAMGPRFAQLTALIAALCIRHTEACTAIAIGRAATLDGSTMSSHTNDCEECDPRVAYIPPKSYPAGAKRAIFAPRGAWPRFVGAQRSEVYAATEGQQDAQPIGYIPQVEHTYGYWEATYPLLNEKGLGFGETTCPGKLIGNPAYKNGTALVDLAELMRTAMERCDTARCAIGLMGSLGEEYGFYGEDPGIGGAGEALSVVDRTEAWVFHITAGLNGASATWVAQRVPDNHVAIVANQFSIGHVRCNDEENFLCSSNIFSNARKANLCDFNDESDFHFAACYGPDPRVYEYSPGQPPIPMYMSLRIWRVFSLANPSIQQPVTENVYDYAFSVPVKEKLSHEQVMDWMRDHYEDSEFDMRFGALAGPFGNPNRLEGGPGMSLITGNMPRAISIPRTTYGQVVQSRPDPSKSIVWFATDVPSSSVFVPLFAQANKVAEPYTKGRPEIFSRDSAWWAFGLVANWMNINYHEMNTRTVGPAMRKEQSDIYKSVEMLENSWPDDHEATHVLNQFQTDIQVGLVQRWWALSERLFAEFNDGVYRTPEMNSSSIQFGYPAWYLQMIGFNSDFFSPHWVQPAASPPSLLEIPTAMSRSLSVSAQLPVAHPFGFWPGVLAGIVVAAIPSFFLGRRGGKNNDRYRPLLGAPDNKNC